ncbi:MAG: leucyl aminopeptidase [Xanthomonadales bacterium]|nr:putative cytosol aminopeptidase [Xanthomonadales bacterium]MCC6594099.1 leucyl aminopeptidase [Xanthomonadales bacterium]MCE7930181.1 leucyl aminopeptidase [Xanthomonadales bacterium PRO6]
MLEFKPLAVRPKDVAASLAIVGVFEERMLTSAAAELDAASGGVLKRLMESGDLSGRVGTHSLLHQLPGLATPRVLVVGLGEQRKFDASRFLRATREAHKALKGLPVEQAASYLTEVDVPRQDMAWKLSQSALIADYAAYKYTATLKARPERVELREVQFSAGSYVGDALARASAIAAGVRLARELGNLPPNICNPAYLAEQAHELARRHPEISVQVLERAEMETLGMGALLAVSAGSDHPPKLIAMSYHGGSGAKPHVFVGKGITFDTGGIDIKPAAGMEEMKFDMCGAASVFGLMEAVARLKLPLHVVGIAPAVENMPDGRSYRPSDVVKTMAGHQVEILNTDAEGRLILCDALTWAQRFEPATLIDIATLTGACVVALGSHASGLMSRDDDLANELLAAGERSSDRAWRLPLWEDYQSQLDTGFADFANIGGKYAGAITAGCFLSRFTEGQRWAHLDIAGSAWDAGRKGTATGRPVAMLVEWLLGQP